MTYPLMYIRYANWRVCGRR